MRLTGVEKEVICHEIPCNLEYEGRAAVDVYFQPTALPVVTAKNHQSTEQPEETKESKPFMAATFRGRGLLSKEPREVDGGVYRFDGATEKLVLSQKITHYQTWHHTHSQKLVISDEERVQKAQDLIRVLAALHKPLD